MLDLDLTGARAPADTRVVVAMSGGVDSSVTAALLAEAGFEVIGVTLQLYDHGQAAPSRPGSCCAGQDIRDARRVADHIGIAHYVLDFEDRFRTAVIDDFADSYARGETPIPCIRCNQTVKFADLLDRARELGAQAMVTGHYARIERQADGAMALLAGADATRDQSYFLFATTREQLDFTRFPLGAMDKAQTRAIAERAGLPVAKKPDSQDICFVPDGGYAALIAKLRPDAMVAGDIVDRNGNVLGRHDGIVNFTVGQRRGLDLGGAAEPHYVVRLEAETARVVVGPKDALAVSRVRVRGVNWLDGAPLAAEGRGVTVKLRSTQAAVPATLSAADGGALLLLDQPQAGVSPGQAAVFYDGARVLGGGWISGGA